MNFFTAKFFRTACHRLAIAVVLLAAPGLPAANAPPPGRFLLVFETSPALKKNLPSVKQTLDVLLSSNLQKEMQENDDVAVWTVDRTLHTGTYPLESWSPAGAAAYSARVGEFLAQQSYSRHASLDAIQPLLNRVVKSSERLTVLIFCDNESRLVGTPYDVGVNEIITNSVTKTKGVPPPFILVLRSYRGEYLGCSVNRNAPLNFPKFPPPPAPEPPPIAKPPAPAFALQAAAPPIAVTPIPALIIVGTNASTNISSLTNPPALAPRSATPVAVETNPAPLTKPPPPAANIVAAAATNPQPISNPPVVVKAPHPAPALATTKTSEPAPSAIAPAIVSNPPAGTANSTNGAPAEFVAETSYLWPMFIGSGALVVAAGLAVWLVARTRRPRGSLITSSMQDNPHLRKR